jgi:hypothetical protein
MAMLVPIASRSVGGLVGRRVRRCPVGWGKTYYSRKISIIIYERVREREAVKGEG